jgi:hypothetical protein
VTYKPGEDMVGADILSRYPVKNECGKMPFEVSSIETKVLHLHEELNHEKASIRT